MSDTEVRVLKRQPVRVVKPAVRVLKRKRRAKILIKTSPTADQEVEITPRSHDQEAETSPRSHPEQAGTSETSVQSAATDEPGSEAKPVAEAESPNPPEIPDNSDSGEPVVESKRPPPPWWLGGPAEYEEIKVEKNWIVPPFDALPPDIEKAVQESLEALNHQILKTPESEKVKIKAKLRKALRKRRVKRHMNRMSIDVFVIIAAYRSVVARLKEMEFKCWTASKLLEDEINFDWFNYTAFALENKKYKPKKQYEMGWDHRSIIIKEALALILEPVVKDWLPPHALSLHWHDKSKWPTGSITPDTPPEDVTALEQEKTHVLKYAMERWPGMCDWMEYNLSKGSLKIYSDLQKNHVINMLKHKVSDWILELVNSFWNYERRVRFHNGKWREARTLWEPSYYTHLRLQSRQQLPPCRLETLFTDLVFQHLDTQIKKEIFMIHPLFRRLRMRMNEALEGKWATVERKYFVRSLKSMRKFMTNSDCVVKYYRLGPVIVIGFKGPEIVREFVQKRFEDFLKTDLVIDRKPVGRAFKIYRFWKCDDPNSKYQKAWDSQFDKFTEHYPLQKKKLRDKWVWAHKKRMVMKLVTNRLSAQRQRYGYYDETIKRNLKKKRLLAGEEVSDSDVEDMEDTEDMSDVESTAEGIAESDVEFESDLENESNVERSEKFGYGHGFGDSDPDDDVEEEPAYDDVESDIEDGWK